MSVQHTSIYVMGTNFSESKFSSYRAYFVKSLHNTHTLPPSHYTHHIGSGSHESDEGVASGGSCSSHCCCGQTIRKESIGLVDPLPHKSRPKTTKNNNNNNNISKDYNSI